MTLRELWRSLSPLDRVSLAERCETSAGHLGNVAYGTRSCSVPLAVALERETVGKLKCESLRPDVDWAYLRRASLSTTKRKAG